VKNKIHFFLNEVTDQINSKEAKKYVSDELGYHLKKAKNAWIEKGLNEEDAAEKAIEQMGSPISLGKQLNKVHRPRVDWLMVILLVTTLCLGFLPLFSLGYMDEEHFITYKVIFTLLGGVIALGLMLIDYKKLKKQGWFFYTLGVFILLMIYFFSNTLIGGLPVVKIGPITIESMMAIPFFFLAWASFFNNKRLKVWHFGILFLFSFFLFFIANSISTTYIYIVMVFVMIWWSRLSRKTIIMISALTVSSFLISSLILWQFLEYYQKDRVLGFLNPEKYSKGAGFTILHIKELMLQAGWVGNSMNNEFIPQAHTNFVFVSFTYYYGWIFAIALVLILALFIARMVVVIHKINDSYGKLLLIGATALYAVQFFSNIGMILGFFPMTTMSLPFISYGLMPTLLNAVLIGIVLSVYRRKDMITSSFI
jgi:cell division protein FtsW (lipid II flippase)